MSSDVSSGDTSGGDEQRVSCDRAEEMISAAADDELDRAEVQRLDGHLAGCADCAAFADSVAALNRSVRLRPVDTRPDFVERVMIRADGARLGRGAWVRPALAWCGVVVAVQAVPPLFLAELDGAATHIARHVGASALALAIGFLFAAWRPHRAAGMLPFVAALLATTIVAATLDTVTGERSAVAESVHVAEIVGLVLLWMVAGSPGWERVRNAAVHIRPGRAH